MSHKVLIYTVSFGSPVPGYVDLSTKINSAYAGIHGYDFKNFVLPESFDRNPAWGRVWFLKEHISDYDYMFYIDGDAFFVNQAMTLNQLIVYMDDSPVCGLFARDQTLSNKIFHADRANAGVFLFSRKNDG